MPQRSPRKADRVDGGAQVARHERQVGGLDGDVGAGADREAEVGLRERRRVVDAVADHRDRVALRLQPLDLGHLPGRVDLGQHAVDPDLVRDLLGGLAGVAGQQHRCQAERLQLADRSGAGGLDRVADVQASRLDAVDAHRDPGRAAADGNLTPLDGPGHADDRARCGSRRRPAARPPLPRSARNRLRDRMLRGRLDGAGQPQDIRARRAVQQRHVGQLHTALGDRAGLVEDDRRRPAVSARGSPAP